MIFGLRKDNTLYRGVPDGSENVQLSETSQWVDGLEGSAKRLVEYITDSCTTTSGKDIKHSPVVDCGNRQHLRAVIHFTYQQAGSGSALQAGVIFPSLSGRNERGPPVN